MSMEDFLLGFKKEPEKTSTPIAAEAKPKEEKVIDVFALLSQDNSNKSKSIEETTNIPAITNNEEENKTIVEEASAPIDSALVKKKDRKWRTPCSIENVMEQDEVELRFKHARLPDQSAAFFICLDITGARKMEIATMKVSQFKLVDAGVELSIVRSKHSAQTQPILLKKEWFGVSDYVIPWLKRRIGAKPSYKLIYHFHTEKGKVISEKLHQLDDGSTIIQKIRAKGREITETENVKDVWMFPNMSKQTALTICKKVYGEDLFAHYGRARRLSLLLSNPKASVTLAKSYSGIKSTRVIEKYMMQSKKQLSLAIDLVGQDIQKTDQPQ
jgi:hypothetical protein